MNRKIFQFSTKPITKDARINASKLSSDGLQMVTIDYADDVKDEYRAELIKYLLDYVLPKGMFTLEGEETLIYQGGFSEWLKTYVKLIQTKAAETTVNNIMEWNGLVQPINYKRLSSTLWGRISFSLLTTVSTMLSLNVREGLWTSLVA